MEQAERAEARDGDELGIMRMFEATPEAVFAAWTEPALMARWLGPTGFAAELEAVELRVGGAYRGAMIAPDGRAYRYGGVYREITPPERLSFTFRWDNEPTENLISLSFEPVGARTRMRFVQTPFPSRAARDSHTGGWEESFERLRQLLAGQN